MACRGRIFIVLQMTINTEFTPLLKLLNSLLRLPLVNRSNPPIWCAAPAYPSLAYHNSKSNGGSLLSCSNRCFGRIVAPADAAQVTLEASGVVTVLDLIFDGVTGRALWSHLLLPAMLVIQLSR